MLFTLVALASYAGYRYWNHRLPTDETGRLRRGGTLAILLGVVTMPWLWWTGLPEAVLVAGLVALVIAIRRNHTHQAHT